MFMKLFVLGIDGLMLTALDTFDMPFLKSFCKHNNSHMYTEDLETRGWAKIYTGDLGYQNKSLYEYMEGDGTYKWMERFISGQLCGDEQKPIWDNLNSKGVSVGIMNVPTASPVEEVNGFWVAGGGGGGTIDNTIKESDVFPWSEKELLQETGYIKDERFDSLIKAQKLFNLSDFLDRLLIMTQKRVDAYLKLNEKYDVDFGFIVMRSIVVINFLFAADIKRMMYREKSSFNDTENYLYDFHKKFDTEIDRLVRGLGSTEVILATDHGMTVLEKELNVNRLLVELRYQKSNSASSIRRFFVKVVKSILPYNIKELLKSKKDIYKNFTNIVPFRPSATLAFTVVRQGTLHGIYINDKSRFNGPVPSSGVKGLTNKICAAINNRSDMQVNGITAAAHPYNGQGKYGDLLPDIILTMPSSIKPISWGEKVLNNVDFEEIETNLSGIDGAHYSGVKCKDTVVAFTSGLNEHFDVTEKNDLRQINKVIKSFFGG
jgi:hypothetical protein